MSDILDGVGESMDNPEEQEKIYADVLQEVGIEINELIPDAGSKSVAQKNKVQAPKEDDSLDQMLKELQK
jgi:hypothetical protein